MGVVIVTVYSMFDGEENRKVDIELNRYEVGLIKVERVGEGDVYEVVELL